MCKECKDHVIQTLDFQIYSCGVIEPSDIHPPFVLGLRPMPRLIITYEEDSGDHGNLGNRAEDNFVLGEPKLR